jgi:hypothetical protein
MPDAFLDTAERTLEGLQAGTHAGVVVGSSTGKGGRIATGRTTARNTATTGTAPAQTSSSNTGNAPMATSALLEVGLLQPVLDIETRTKDTGPSGSSSISPLFSKTTPRPILNGLSTSRGVSDARPYSTGSAQPSPMLDRIDSKQDSEIAGQLRDVMRNVAQVSVVEDVFPFCRSVC